MAGYPVADGPHNDAWKELLPYCFALVDEVVQTHDVAFPIEIGGGSMLLRRYRHRKSRDLDIFVSDVRLVRWCSPRVNDVAADLFADYGEEATAMKLILGMQEIDIVAAATIIQEGATETATLAGREVLIERPREILAKKIVYRGRTFQPRDAFDLACVALAEPEELAAIQPWLSPVHIEDLEARLGELEPVLAGELAKNVEVYPDFDLAAAQCLELAGGVVSAWREQLTPKVTAPPYPRETHHASYSRDGRTVVIREWDPEARRFKRTGNTLGPAIVGPEGASYWLGGEKLSEQEWRERPEVQAARGESERSAPKP